MTANNVLEGREPLMAFTVHTDNGPVTVGRLWCKDGVFSFEGKTDVSAKIFVDMVCDQLNNPSKYQDGRIIVPR